MENKKPSKKKWPGIFLLLCLLAACAAGTCYYITVYSVTKSVIGDIEVVQSEEAVQDAEDSRSLEEEPMTENEPAAGNELLVEENMTGTADVETDGSVQIENLPEIPAVLEGTVDSESEKNDGLLSGIEIEEEAGEKSVTEETEKESESEKEDEDGKASEPENEDELGEESEADKEDELEGESELVKNDDEDETGRRDKSEDAEEDDDRTGMMTDISIYTEEEFRDMCGRVDYKKLLRSQELYLNAAVTETLTVIEQVDGGLFDENIYYLCRREDEQGITRYYIIRDDREDDAAPILEGDALRIYGQLFGSCKLPGYLVKTQPVVPALTMVYYDLLEE